MSGHLAVDFGTSNTVFAVWDETRQEGVTFDIPDFSRVYQQGQERISVVPSLINYAADKRRWLGNQVLQRNLYQSNRTFRWMKRYIGNRSPIRVRLDDGDITPYTAGKDFLSTLLLFARQELNLSDEEIALSVPVESYEHYENWLLSVTEAAGITRCRLIDEPSAAALGYGAHMQPGSVYLIFDFGGGTLHTSVVLMDEDTDSHRRCRVLGKSGISTGGTSIDQWLYQEVLRKNNKAESDDDIRRISNILLVECERAKERLSMEENVEISVMNPDSGTLIDAAFTRSKFEELLDQHELYAEINQIIRQAINSARERGYGEDAIQSVLMVGGSSQIPSVQRTLRQFFGKERIRSHRPLDAIACGAAAFVAGVDFFDHIQHDYAIRYINPLKGQYEYKVIVNRGTPYPTSDPVSHLSIKGSYDGQKQLGIAIFEMGQAHHRNAGSVELVFDPTGAARIMPITPQEEEQRSYFWMNENSPTFLSAEPAAISGEPRFEVEFQIDTNKRLTVTVRDIKTGRLTHQNYPVVKLT